MKKRKEEKKGKKKKKIDNSFFEQQPKMNKGDKDFILNYYCEEQDSVDAGDVLGEVGDVVGVVDNIVCDVVEQEDVGDAKKDIISF